MKDKMTMKGIMLHPAAITAVLYILTNIVYWGWISGCEAVPIIGEIFALVCTGGLNAGLLVLLCSCPEFRSFVGGSLLTLAALLLFAFLPLCIEINRVLPTDAQAPLAFIFWGGAAAAAHALLVGLMVLISPFFRRQKAESKKEVNK